MIFYFFWFNNIMEIQYDEISWRPKERVKYMREIINDYRRLFLNHNYSDVHIWKIILRKYKKHWDYLMYDSHEYEKIKYGHT